ncbi:MAG: WYL domain-containing protein [Gemmatimonadales bacterium]
MTSTKLQRWIDLVAALLGRHTAVTLEELTRLVPAYNKGQTLPALRRMFERDKDALRALGIPFETIERDDLLAYRVQSTHFYLPYLATVIDGKVRKPKLVDKDGYRALSVLQFLPDEVEALRTAIARVRALGQPELAADVDRASRKMALDLEALARDDAATSAVHRDRSDSTAFNILMDALSHRQRVTFTYYAIGGDRSSERTVRPYGLFFLNAHWYLAAAEEGEPVGPVKNFRVSRISAPRVHGTSRAKAQFEIPASFVLGAHARDWRPWELGDTEAIEVEVEFKVTDGVAAAGARLGEEIPKRPGHRRFRVRRLDPFVRWLLSFAGAARPIAPVALVEAYRAEVRVTAALYREVAGG